MAEELEDMLDFEGQTEQAGKALQLRNEITGEFEHTPNDFEDEFRFTKIDGVSRKSDRAIFFAGDLMIPQLRRSRPDFVTGGEYFGTDFPALALSKFALYRGRITPVRLQPRALPADEPIKNSEIEKFDETITAEGGTGRVQYVKAYPGDQLETIVFGARDGSGKGYVEITAFEGLEWKLPETKRLYNDVQLKIFPNWMEIMAGAKDSNGRRVTLPPTLRGLREIIYSAQSRYSSDDMIVSVCTDMLESCSQFENWGVGYLQQEAVRIRAGVNQQGGYVHKYSQVAELLLVQLEMKRESLVELPDNSNQESSAAMLEMAKGFTKMAETMAENQATISKFLAQSASGSAQNAEPPKEDEKPPVEAKAPVKPANKTTK